MKQSFTYSAVILTALLLLACTGTPMTRAVLDQQAQQPRQSIELDSVPFFPQQQYQCGPAALATVLTHAGVDVTPELLHPKVYLPSKKGTLQVELQAAIRRFGLIPYRPEASLDALLRQIASGRPVLVFQNLGLSWLPQWHYAVVVGYDLSQGYLILRSGRTRRYLLDLDVFERTWRRASYWSLVSIKPGEIPIDAQENIFFEAVANFEKIHPGEKPIQAYRAGLQYWPKSRLLGMGLGNAYYQQNRPTQAASTYQKVLLSHPNYAPAHNNLAQVLMERGQLQLARKHAEAAISSDDEHRQQYQDTLTAIMSRLSKNRPLPSAMDK